ncbi:uncharacterized protein METZ01_LOCUS14178 [marine metagenome]|uniref:Uncharacterized protein n=1 Tax=marine metagenome TaxID=408172 RepID=A0A381P437_9ZZZZ
MSAYRYPFSFINDDSNLYNDQIENLHNERVLH